MEREVSLMEVLDARERRAQRQQELLTQYALPLVSFTLNIAGPMKNAPLVRRAFREGTERLEDALRGESIAITAQESIDAPTGCEGFFVLRGGGELIKRLCIALEDEDGLGRLFDLDVIDPAHGKWDRTALGFSERGCLICGKAGKDCASRRLHSVAELQKKTTAILRSYFSKKDAQRLAGQAAHALLTEVCTTPKPGLVDRANNGSHWDMDIFTFLDSTTALLPYFIHAVEIGQETATLAPEETFARLRTEGLRAERAMFTATQGVNTHKGAVYSMGLVCGAAGRLWTEEGFPKSAETILDACADLAAPSTQRTLDDLCSSTASTAGEAAYLHCGLRGVRGEAADGFPSVRNIALPAIEAALFDGRTFEQAGAYALLHLIAQVGDTNLIARGGMEGQRWAAQYAEKLLEQGKGFDNAALERFDAEMIKKNLSPGGCADLLAIAFFFANRKYQDPLRNLQLMDSRH